MVSIVLALLDIGMIGKKNDQEAHRVSLRSEAVLIKKDLIYTDVLHHWLFCEDSKL